jgi:hypothetical protein
MNKGQTLTIEGIERIEAVDLRDTLGEAQVSILPAPAPDGPQHGSPDLISVAVQLGPALLTALAVWLAGKHWKSGEKDDLDLVRMPDGSLKIKWRHSSSASSTEAPDAKVVASILDRLKQETGLAGPGGGDG